MRTRMRAIAHNRHSRGFTLMELLVVIGIILLLISILLPTVAHVRMAAYRADTQNEINNLMTAIGDYQTTFNAYPGPFSNDQIEQTANATKHGGIGGGSPAGNTLEYYNSSTASYGAPPAAPFPQFPWNVTGAENLVLGLLGGLRVDPGTGVIAFAPADVGLGPLGLGHSPVSPYTLLNPSRTSAFIQSTSGSSNMLSTSVGQFQDTTSGNTASDSPIPEFVDRFPPGHLPILYLRARVGAPNAVGFVNGSTWGASAGLEPNAYPCQYDLGDVAAYVHSKIGNMCGETLDSTMTNGATHGLIGVAPPGDAPGSYMQSDAANVLDPMNKNNPGNAGANGLAYLMLPGGAPTSSTDYNTVKPRMVDEYILISAGPDGIYGNGDDITNFGSVMP
ncbi:MAG: prepilin-type N-terminal cleavage/methylation domain-containing protein [Tepidisphaeraceae bacterium]